MSHWKGIPQSHNVKGKEKKKIYQRKSLRKSQPERRDHFRNDLLTQDGVSAPVCYHQRAVAAGWAALNVKVSKQQAQRAPLWHSEPPLTPGVARVGAGVVPRGQRAGLGAQHCVSAAIAWKPRESRHVTELFPPLGQFSFVITLNPFLRVRSVFFIKLWRVNYCQWHLKSWQIQTLTMVCFNLNLMLFHTDIVWRQQDAASQKTRISGKSHHRSFKIAFFNFDSYGLYNDIFQNVEIWCALFGVFLLKDITINNKII